MSSVGASGRRRTGLVEGGGASGSATARQSYYHCYNCDRMVTLIEAGQLVCPICHGVVLEELGIPPTPPPPPPPRGSSNWHACIFSLFGTAGFESDSDSDLELSCPLPPPPPFFTTNTDFSYSDSDLNFSDPLPPPPPPLPPLTSGTARDRLEIDFSDQLPDIDNHFSILPPPPPPPPLPAIVPDRTVDRRLPPTILSPPPPPPPPPPSSDTWDYYFVEPVRRSTSMSAISTTMEEEEEEMLLDTKITEEVMLGGEFTQCAVCMDNIEVNQLVLQMPCKHMYHSNCLSPWLESHNTCPVCRYSLNPNATNS